MLNDSSCVDTTGYVNHHGVELFYRIKGKYSDNPVLVFIHGNESNSLAWVCQQDFFSKYYLTIAIDMRGFGKSSKPPGSLSAEIHRGDLHYLLKKLDLLKYGVFICGWSDGGVVAQSYTLTYPEEVKKLILVDTTPQMLQSSDFPYGRTPDQEAEILYGLVEKFEESAIKGSILVLPEKCKDIDKLRAYVVKVVNETGQDVDLRQTVDIAKFSSVDKLSKIKAPTLIFVGLKDAVINPQASVFLNLNVPNSILYEFPEAGHIPFWTFTKTFNRQLLKFLRDNYKCQICTKIYS